MQRFVGWGVMLLGAGLMAISVWQLYVISIFFSATVIGFGFLLIVEGTGTKQSIRLAKQLGLGALIVVTAFLLVNDTYYREYTRLMGVVGAVWLLLIAHWLGNWWTRK